MGNTNWHAFRFTGLIALLTLATGGAPALAEPPVVTVSRDNTVLAESCRIVIPPHAIIQDAGNNGVLLITASDIVVEHFEIDGYTALELDIRQSE